MKVLKNVATQVAFALILLVSFNSVAQITIDPNDPGNATNPFDDAGKMHNEAVKLFLEKYSDEKLSVEEILDRSYEICVSLGMKGEKLSAVDFYSGMNDAKNNFRSIINSTDLSNSGKLKFQELIDYMMNNGLAGSLKISEFNKYILTFENNVLSNRLYSKSDRESLLKYSSIARHSSNFWYTYENSSSYENNADGNPPRWIRWVIVGASDIAGAAAGGGFNVISGVGASSAVNEVIDEVK